MGIDCWRRRRCIRISSPIERTHAGGAAIFVRIFCQTGELVRIRRRVRGQRQAMRLEIWAGAAAAETPGAEGARRFRPCVMEENVGAGGGRENECRGMCR